MARNGQALSAPKQARSQLSTGRLMDAAAELIVEVALTRGIHEPVRWWFAAVRVFPTAHYGSSKARVARQRALEAAATQGCSSRCPYMAHGLVQAR